MNRLMLRTAVDCGGKFIESLARLEETAPGGTQCDKPTLGSIGESVILELKELASRGDNHVAVADVAAVESAYNKWWAAEQESLEGAYADCTDPETWLMVAHHLASAAPYMAATHSRACNLDMDCSNIPSLRYAPINTDVVESGFAHFDDALKLNASINAMIGVAHAKALKAFSTDGEKAEKAKATALKRRNAGGGSSSLSSDAAALVKQWDTTSFFKMPREKRWEVIKSIQKNYTQLCVEDPKVRLEAHDEAAVERSREVRREEINKARARWMNYKKMDSIKPVESAVELQRLFDSFGGGDDKGRNEAMKDQIRVRLHVYRLKAADMPNMDRAGLGQKHNSERLLKELKPVVDVPLPRKPREPSPYPERADHAAETDEALQLKEDYMKEFQQAWKDVMEMTKSGTFTAPRRASGGGVGAPRKTRKPAARQERSVRDDEAALLGSEFEEDGTQWKVLAVDWSDDDAAMVVWYYDVAAAGNMTEEEIESMRIDGKAGEVDALEFSSVSEVRKWVALSGSSG